MDRLTSTVKSRKFHFSLGATVGVIVVLSSLHFSPCNNTSSIIFSLERNLVPCPASPPPPARATGKVALMLVVPESTPIRVGDSFVVTLELDATGTPVNAVDAALAYPDSLVRLVSKDESITPFAIRLGGQTSSSLNETIQVQPNPGIASVAPLAAFTFKALEPGTAAITIASSSEVLANDGFGTNVLGSVQNVSLLIR